MAEASLQDRLRGHAKAFDGLLSLIPAKMYYGEDTSGQWQKKKQTKKEAAAARRGKLDPDSELNRNAKEVMDERAKTKRKQRELEQEDDEDDEDDESNDGESIEALEGIETERPGEGLRMAKEESSQTQKPDESDKPEEDVEETQEELAAEPAPKLSKKDAKREAKREKKSERRAELNAKKHEETPKSEDGAQQDASKDDAEPEDVEMASVDESDPQSPTFDVEGAVNGATDEQASTTTSLSSTIPPSEKPKHIKMPADTTALRARLAAKIEALRAARKADGPDGKPIRTRQELIESRRFKETQRKERKKELRKQAKLEEDRKREEALASNSPGVMSPAVGVMSPAVEVEEGSGFSFGRVAFGDGSQMSHDLSYVMNQGKKKGPSDLKTALLKVQNQKKRLEEMDPEKRADVAEKDAWLTARRRAEGEKIHNDEANLKKSLKRKEATKKKSEKAWKERTNGVQKAQKDRQKKRQDNLQKRRDDKVLGKAGKKKKGASGGKKKKGGRPGFEGSFGVGGGRK